MPIGIGIFRRARPASIVAQPEPKQIQAALSVKTWAYSAPVYAAPDGSVIDCTIEHPIFGAIPFTARASDADPAVSALHAAIIAGAETVSIGDYTAPAKPAIKSSGSLPEKLA